MIHIYIYIHIYVYIYIYLYIHIDININICMHSARQIETLDLIYFDQLMCVFFANIVRCSARIVFPSVINLKKQKKVMKCRGPSGCATWLSIEAVV